MQNESFIKKEYIKIYDEFIHVFRFAFIVVLVFIMYTDGNPSVSDVKNAYYYLVFFLVYAFILAVVKKWNIQKVLKYKAVFSAIDLCIISASVAISGGKNSHIYLFYMFFIVFFSLAYDFKKSLAGWAICSALYTGALFITGQLPDGQVVFRIIFLLLLGLFIRTMNERITNHIYNITMHDSLTSLYNYNYFSSSLEYYIKQSENDKNGVSLAILDVDNFKMHNDNRGHLEGDRLLKNISSIIKESIRSNDIASRYGGDEFTIVLPNTDNPTAVKICERIKDRIEENLKSANGDTITVSIGVATCPCDGKSSKDLFNAADKALYQAKNTGRNAVVSV